MVITEQLKSNQSYQKYLMRRNEAWRRAKKDLDFSFSREKMNKNELGDNLITKGGQVLQMSNRCVKVEEQKQTMPAWRDEFLYQVMLKQSYDLCFSLSDSLKWEDQQSQKGLSRILCVVEKGESAHLSQYLNGSGLRILDIVIRSGATLRHDVYLNAKAYDYINVYVDEKGTYEQIYALGGSARRATRVLLVGDESSAKLSGCLSTSEYFSEHVVIDHLGKSTQSSHKINTAIDGRCDVSSEVRVHKGAVNSESKQSIEHLLLSDTARAFSKPALEISVDEVACEHGTTMSMIDDQLLFYMLTRGLDKVSAREMYLNGFIGRAYELYPECKSEMVEFIQKVRHGQR